MSNIGIALQLYTLREQAARDLAGTLAMVRETGFEYVEWSGMPVLNAAQIRSALASAGLKAIGGHCTHADLKEGLSDTIAHWQALGVPDLSIVSPPESALLTADAWRAWAAQAGHWAQCLEDAGIRLACHHAALEVQAFPGEVDYPLDVLLQLTARTPLCAEFDTAWLALGGADPAEAIRPYPDRSPLLHVKDIAAEATAELPVFVPLGTGALNWPAIFDAAEEIGVEWYVYEQDTPGEDPWEDLRRSYRFLFEFA
jgi:sugar phosphate isomerase/epimerase